MSQSGTESEQPSKGHSPDGNNGASQLGQGMSAGGMVQGWLSKELWQGHIDWFNGERLLTDYGKLTDFERRWMTDIRLYWYNILRP